MNLANIINSRQPCFQLPAMSGMIERRMLVNFRCEPAVLARLLPSPFRPKLIRGWGMAGICLIRLGEMHPSFLPAIGGLASENAAHRIAVEWDENGVIREGVFVPRRATNAWLNRVVGGRFFPGIQHAARFEVVENDNRFKLKMQSEDGTTAIDVIAELANELPPGSVFKSLDEASEFFRNGAIGWSSHAISGEFGGIELVCREWRMEPLAVERADSSFFGNTELFPAGSVKFDSAFLMRGILHEWHARGRLLVSEKTVKQI
jgi:hypothetical protein